MGVKIEERSGVIVERGYNRKERLGVMIERKGVIIESDNNERKWCG